MTRRSLFRRLEELERCAPSALAVSALSDQQAEAEYAGLCQQRTREVDAVSTEGDCMSVQEAFELYSSMLQIEPRPQRRKSRQSSLERR